MRQRNGGTSELEQVPGRSDPDWKLIAQAAMQQRDRANALAHNLEIDLILARAKIEALETGDSVAERKLPSLPPEPTSATG